MEAAEAEADVLQRQQAALQPVAETPKPKPKPGGKSAKIRKREEARYFQTLA